MEIGKVTMQDTVTTQGEFRIIYRDGQPIARVREIGKRVGDLRIESAYLDRAIQCPCGRFADLDQPAAERIVGKILAENPSLESGNDTGRIPPVSKRQTHYDRAKTSALLQQGRPHTNRSRTRCRISDTTRQAR